MVLASAGKAVTAAAKSHGRLSNLPSDAHAGVRFNSNGDVDGTAATSLNWSLEDGRWLHVGSASDYEVRFTKNSGANPTSGTLNTWLGLGTSRSVSYSQSGIGTLSGSFTVELREASTQNVIDSTTFTLITTVEG